MKQNNQERRMHGATPQAEAEVTQVNPEKEAGLNLRREIL